MEEENDNKKRPDLPSNYVTLLHLRERWIKEKQRKEKEKEEEEAASAAAKQKQKQQETQESEQKPKDDPPIGGISKHRYHRRNRNFKVIGAGADREETNAAVSASVLVEENGNESGVVNKEVKSEDLRNKKKKKWNKKNKKGKKEKDGEEARAQNKEKAEEEQEEMGRDAHAPPVIPARRSETKSETRVEYRPKINDVAETSYATVAEIDGKFGNVSIGKVSDRLSLQRQNRVTNYGDRAYRGYNSVFDRRNRHYRGGYDMGSNRGTGHYKAGNWNFNRGNGQGRGGYRRLNGSRERNGRQGGMVWVRKEEVADGGDSGDAAGNQSSGGSFKELE